MFGCFSYDSVFIFTNKTKRAINSIAYAFYKWKGYRRLIAYLLENNE